MYKILFVDDEAAIRAGFSEYASFLGHEVVEASDGMEAVTLCKEGSFDIVIMDIMMPKMDGFSACKEIKKTTDVPILILSARSEEYDKLHGFELDIDDYVTKPFSYKELLARVQVIVSRHRKMVAPLMGEGVYTLEGLTIDTKAHIVKVDGERVELTPKEYDLLVFLTQNENIALSRERILNKVWGHDYYGDGTTVNTHIKMLRGHLGNYKDHIVTLRGMGYRFER